MSQLSATDEAARAAIANGQGRAIVTPPVTMATHAAHLRAAVLEADRELQNPNIGPERRRQMEGVIADVHATARVLVRQRGEAMVAWANRTRKDAAPAGPIRREDFASAQEYLRAIERAAGEQYADFGHDLDIRKGARQ